jgi:uncharacterized integral membrane protein
MPWKTLFVILVCGVFLLFVVGNLNYSSSVRIWFGEAGLVPEVPVYLTAFASFFLGLLCAVPISVSIGMRIKRKEKQKLQAAKPPKKGLFGKKKKEEPDVVSPEDSEKNSYGID